MTDGHRGEFSANIATASEAEQAVNGGDKNLADLQLPPEDVSSIGKRVIRLYLFKPELFRPSFELFAVLQSMGRCKMAQRALACRNAAEARRLSIA